MEGLRYHQDTICNTKKDKLRSLFVWLVGCGFLFVLFLLKKTVNYTFFSLIHFFCRNYQLYIYSQKGSYKMM